MYTKKQQLKILHLNDISANFCCFIIGDFCLLLPEPVTHHLCYDEMFVGITWKSVDYKPSISLISRTFEFFSYFFKFVIGLCEKV